jgi:hypothetical protein
VLVTPYPRATATRQRDTSPSGEGVSEHLFQIELSWMSPQVTRNKTPEDHQSHNWRYRSRESSWQGKIYCYKGVQAQRHSKHKEQEVCLLFIPNTVGSAPLLGLVKLGFSICSWSAKIQHWLRGRTSICSLVGKFGGQMGLNKNVEEEPNTARH